jgi:hypothetical protein
MESTLSALRFLLENRKRLCALPSSRESMFSVRNRLAQALVRRVTWLNWQAIAGLLGRYATSFAMIPASDG